MRGRDLIRARARRDGVSYAEALRRMGAELEARRTEALASHKPGATYAEIVPMPAPGRVPKVHRRWSAIFTGPPALDETVRSTPRCRTSEVWTVDDPRLTDDPAAVTCGQCRRFDS